MFEINSREYSNTRQATASRKAREDKPSVIQKTPDTFEVYGSGFNTYNVRFLRSDDKVYAQCECEAGQNNFPCYHVMRVYDEIYSKALMATGRALLNRQTAVGNLGYISTKKVPGKVIELQAGQVFEATVPVRLTVEKQ